MLGLIKKDLVLASVNSFGMLPFLAVYFINSREYIDPAVVISIGNLCLIFFIYAMTVIELIEAKSNGYLFLFTMPISPTQIISSKVGLILMIAICHIIFSNILFLIMKTAGIYLLIANLYMICTITLGLLLASLMYIVIFRFRLGKVLMISLYVLPVIIGIFMFGIYELNHAYIDNFDLSSITILQIALLILAIVIIGTGLFLYLMQKAGKLLSRHMV